MTFDFDDRTVSNNPPANSKSKKGEVKIILSKYEINKTLSDDVFK
jgi:hypothetical protein